MNLPYYIQNLIYHSQREEGGKKKEGGGEERNELNKEGSAKDLVDINVG